MARKSKNRTVYEVLDEGPIHHYGCESDEERECCELAEKMILDLKQPEQLRKDLLKVLIRFKERIVNDARSADEAGESL